MQKGKEGISLIVLIITIIVIIILASAVIISLNNSGIIERANETVFKSNIETYKTELNLYLANRYMENSKYKATTLNASSSTTPSITDVIPSMSDRDTFKFEIINGKLAYVGENERELTWSTELGIVYSEQTEEELYNEKYSTELANALVYGNYSNGKYTLKEEYQSVSLPSTTIAIPYGATALGYPGFSSCDNGVTVIIPETLNSFAGYTDGIDTYYLNEPFGVNAYGLNVYFYGEDLSWIPSTFTHDGNATLYVKSQEVIYTIEQVDLSIASYFTIATNYEW